MKLNNTVYDILKWIALVAMDAIGLFYKTMAGVWNLPYGDQILATCTAISVLIGALIGISGSVYKYNSATNELENISEKANAEVQTNGESGNN